MTAKEYLQGKYEWHKKHWNEHEHVDDEFTANEMEAYHQAKLKLLGIGGVSEILNIKDSDIATIEALHDLLLDSERYTLNHPTLKRGRELTAKLYKILGYNSN